MIKVGIECENIEDPKSRWGVGQMTFNLLKEYANNPELQKKFKLYLYFKQSIPDDEFLKNPIFEKRIIGISSFNVFYHILMPIKAIDDNLDWMFFPAYMLPPLYFGKSVVMLTEDVFYEYKYGTLPFRYRLAYGLFTNWASRMATKILAISETSKKNVSKLYDIKPDRIFVSRPGVGIMEKSKIKDQNDSSKLKNEEYILYVGQMFPRRHARETLLAFKTIASEFSELKLIMVGKDKYPIPVIADMVKEVNADLGSERVIYHDYLEKREDIDSLYAGAKALAYVSDKEAFGLPPMEALAFGVLPIVADNELGHELFEDLAVYAKNSTSAGIAEAMRKALSDEKKSAEAKHFGPGFVKRYNWKSFANNFFENIK